jgi:RNA polymerase sigma factor (sigma-70 family)
VFAYAGNRGVADDAVAEAFAQALHGNGIRDVDIWVWTAAFRIARGELARRGKRDSGVIETTYELAEPADDIVQALSSLSPKQRAAVVLHHYAGYRVKEIAEMLDSTGRAVRVHLSQGRKRLRTILTEVNISE